MKDCFLSYHSSRSSLRLLLRVLALLLLHARPDVVVRAASADLVHNTADQGIALVLVMRKQSADRMLLLANLCVP
jgi:hypothetical protein